MAGHASIVSSYWWDRQGRQLVAGWLAGRQGSSGGIACTQALLAGRQGSSGSAAGQAIMGRMQDGVQAGRAAVVGQAGRQAGRTYS